VGRLPLLLSPTQLFWQKKEGALGGSTNYPANCLRHSAFATCPHHGSTAAADLPLQLQAVRTADRIDDARELDQHALDERGSTSKSV
jgi:hypothetical protein